jgi:hypothetical protein
VQHGLQCFARLVRVLLGETAIADEKCECGPSLVVLGICIELSEEGYTFKPAEAKVAKWGQTIAEALRVQELLPGAASKLAGQLSWGCCQTFKCFGRAMLRWVALRCFVCSCFADSSRPIFDQKSRRDGALGGELRAALEWWRDVLRLRICELRRWEKVVSPPVHLFVDASGSPPYLGAVVFCDGRVWWTHMAAPAAALERFRARADNQIMGLELLAISLGLCSFEWLLEGRNVVVHSDNTGSEMAFRRGSARCWDHAQLVHAQWFQLVRMRVEVFVRRVATDDNIADLPSRCEFGVLRWNRAQDVKPTLALEYEGDAWKILQERWHLG